jgi:hypothetical protein
VPVDAWEADGKRYCVQATYALPDDAWCLELSETVPAPAAWAAIDGAVRELPGNPFLIAVVPDEDLTRSPSVVIGDHEVPFEVLQRFVALVEAEDARVRSAAPPES